MNEGIILQGSVVSKNLEMEADAVIVGSGCAGAVTAGELQDAGISCVVLEEGGHYTREQYGRFTPAESLRYLYRDYGASVVLGRGDTPNIYLLLGKCVGGGSVVNGGVCFRTPDYVIDGWRNDHGLTEITHEEMGKAFDRVEERLAIAPVPEDLHLGGVRRFRDASNRLGYHGYTISRNVKDCDGCCRCIFGCPHDAKRNVLVTYLERALKRGTRIVSEARVEKILTKGGKAVGVEARVIQPLSKAKLHRIRVRAKVVILAAGAVHTPILLLKNRLANSSGQVGRNLTLHPAARAYGYFDDEVDKDRGAMQSYVIDEFYGEAIKLITIAIPPEILAATLPGFGRANLDLMARANHFSAFGTMISDVSTGRIRPGPFQTPIMTYRMLPQDKARLVKAVKLLGKIYFEAGARKVYLPFQLHHEAATPAELEALAPEAIAGQEIESSAQHPLGTCRMGKAPKSSVVGPWNETHDVKDLYIFDGSVIPTSVAVNPQVTIMGLATRAAWRLIAERF